VQENHVSLCGYNVSYLFEGWGVWCFTEGLVFLDFCCRCLRGLAGENSLRTPFNFIRSLLEGGGGAFTIKLAGANRFFFIMIICSRSLLIVSVTMDFSL
jgi:hypothetical protein